MELRIFATPAAANYLNGMNMMVETRFFQFKDSFIDITDFLPNVKSDEEKYAFVETAVNRSGFNNGNDAFRIEVRRISTAS